MSAALLALAVLATTFSAFALDRDGDGVDDSQDCAPLIPSAWAIAGEIPQIDWIDRAEIAWPAEPLAHWYDVHRGVVPDSSPFGYTHECTSSQQPATAFQDDEEPAPGALFYYLIGATNECGAGSLGTGSSGPRPVNQACPPSDGDGDGVPDGHDLCPYLSDPAQDDADLDQVGTACDVCPAAPDPLQQDEDRDGIGNACDNCPGTANIGQTNSDGDALGDACDSCAHDPANDADGDGVCGDLDRCPLHADPDQADADSDGWGDACDACPADAENDGDGDGICGDTDNCPVVVNLDQANADGDGHGDICDPCVNDPANDADADGVCGDIDNCAATANPNQANADSDALGDSCDGCPHDAADDEDGDGVCGDLDNCLSIPNPDQANADGDGFGDVCDACMHDSANDVDGDGVCGDLDNCPAMANPAQADADGDMVGDACDTTVIRDILIVDQDIRSDFPNMAQQRQQASSRLGRRNGGRFRALAWFDVSTIPVQANIRSVTIVYHTTSGDPTDIDTNGDSPPLGGPITIEIREVLRPWNHDEPFTYPPNLGDNEVNVTAGETTWRYALYPAQWEVAGAHGATDSGPAVAWTTVPSSLDARFELTSSGLADMVQRWVSGTASNHGVLLRATDSDESATSDNRKIFCGKGFPLETSTGLPAAAAEAHRPFVRIEYDFP